MGVNEAVGSGTSLAVGSTELQLRSHDDQQATADSLSGRIIVFTNRFMWQTHHMSRKL